MRFEFILRVLPSDGGIAPRLGKVEQHRLLEELEPLNLLDGALGRFHLVEHDEGLALGLEVRLGDEIDDIAVFREYFRQRFFELVDFNPLLQVANLRWVNHGPVGIGQHSYHT